MVIRIVLGSGSPRRRELLARLVPDFEVRVPDLDETPLPGEDPVGYVDRLACAKAEAVARELAGADFVVIGADTTVELDGTILGKPADRDEAAAMLRALSARAHHVHTGLAVVRSGRPVEHAVATTLVRFAPVSEAAIEWYLDTGEPFDKAGAYALQGAGGVFVEEVVGSVSGVVGLPLTLLVELFRRLDVAVIG